MKANVEEDPVLVVDRPEKREMEVQLLTDWGAMSVVALHYNLNSDLVSDSDSW